MRRIESGDRAAVTALEGGAEATVDAALRAVRMDDVGAHLRDRARDGEDRRHVAGADRARHPGPDDAERELRRERCDPLFFKRAAGR